MKIKLYIFLLFILHVCLVFIKIDHTTMWDDEASIVWFAENYLKYGDIVGYDGDNLFSYRNGSLINNELIYNNPPLDIYYVSYIIKYIGKTDFIIRSSFAVLGIIALVFYALIIHHFTKKHKVWYLFSMIILFLSVNYILIEQNARYYSLNFLFASISFWATLQIEKYEAKFLKILFLLLQLISIGLLFFSHYLAALCWWFMCIVVMYRTQQIKFKITYYFNYIWIGSSVLLLFSLAYYFLTHQVLNRPDLVDSDPIYVKYFKLFGWLFNDLNRLNVFPVWGVLLLIYLFIKKRYLFNSEFKSILIYSLCFLGTIYIINPQPTSKSTSFDIRYVYPIIPIIYTITSYIFYLVYEKVKFGKLISFITVFIFINSTLICYIPESTPFRLLLPSYVKERLNPYPTAYSESIYYIQTKFKSPQKILTIPGFHNTVFLRYVSDKIKITNTLDSATTPFSHNKLKELNQECLYIGKCKPDYVFLFSNYDEFNNYPYSKKDYMYIDTIPVYATSIDITRPELYWHSFGPKTQMNPDKDYLYILHN